MGLLARMVTGIYRVAKQLTLYKQQKLICAEQDIACTYKKYIVHGHEYYNSGIHKDVHK